MIKGVSRQKKKGGLDWWVYGLHQSFEKWAECCWLTIVIELTGLNRAS